MHNDACYVGFQHGKCKMMDAFMQGWMYRKKMKIINKRIKTYDRICSSYARKLISNLIHFFTIISISFKIQDIP